MTKRISQPNTVVVPAVHADGVDGKVVATKTVVVPAEAEVASAKVEVKADEAPVTVVAEPVAALVAPASMAMVAEPLAAAEPAAASASAAQEGDDNHTDLTPYIVGGVLVLGGVLAVALSSGDTDPIPVTPAPTNTAPNFTSPTTATIAENAPVATVVYDANASDVQGNAIVFSIGGTDAALFNFDTATGVATLKTSANFEAKPSYSFTVTATDNGTPPLSVTQTITVTVSNVNEQPTFASATATATTPENVPTATVVFQAQATDPDAVGQVAPFPAGSVIAGYTLGGADAGLFNISSTGAVTFKASPDFETPRSAAGTNTYTFTVIATDNAATPLASAAQTVTLTVTDVAEGPTFTSPATATVAENAPAATVIFDANATGATAFALSGADAAAFNFDTATGVATLKTPADFETKSSYNVTVTATGPTGPSTQNIVVSVTNVNETPAFAAGARTSTFAENVAAGTTVITAGGATDPDGTATPNTLTYTLTGADAASFAVNATTGAVTFVASPNFEAKASYAFNLVATDQGGLTATQANTVTITNVNETPTFGAATQMVSFAENGTGTVLTATATDPDGTVAPNTLAYTLTGADAALFNVSTAGVVTFRAAPDFETPRSAANSNVYSFNVVATDQGGLTSTQAETVTVTDIAVEGVRIDGAGIPASTNANYDAAVGNVTYLESGAVGNISTINNFTSGDIIQTDVATSNYSFSSIGTTLVITYNNNGTSSQISLPGAAGNAFIFNEATAEQAVGFDFFRSSAAAPPPASNALTGTATLDAANAAVTYNESANSPNTTTITNFTSDDRIVVTGVSGSGAGQVYSFTTNGSDLQISFSDNGIPSQITLVGAANPNVFVFNEATAEQAVGFDFFRYG